MDAQRIVYGLHPVREVLRSQRVRALFIAPLDRAERDDALPALREEARRLGLCPVERPRGELDRLAGGGVHQGVVALCGEYAYAKLTEILDRAQASGQPPLCLLLDGVTDPQNLGALLRSTHVLGGHGVVLPQDRACPMTAAVTKASAGASELLPVARVTNLVRAMQELKAAGLWLSATGTGDGAQPPWSCDLRAPTGLVLGSEGKGLRPLVRKTCDQAISIPMHQGLHGASLNVAVAGAVLLYEALRQRGAMI